MAMAVAVMVAGQGRSRGIRVAVTGWVTSWFSDRFTDSVRGGSYGVHFVVFAHRNWRLIRISSEKWDSRDVILR